MREYKISIRSCQRQKTIPFPAAESAHIIKLQEQIFKVGKWSQQFWIDVRKSGAQIKYFYICCSDEDGLRKFYSIISMTLKLKN